VGPAGTRWVAIQGGAAIGGVVRNGHQAEVDNGELAIADQQIVRLEVLVGDALLFEVVQTREQVLG